MPTFNNCDDLYGVAQLIVDPTAGFGNYQTIGAALTAATSGQTIFIRPGTYTENPTLKAGVNLSAFVGDGYTGNVIILGNSTLSTAGTVTISGIQLQTNSANCLTVSGSVASIVNLIDCFVNCTNSTGISYSSSSANSQISLYQCNVDLGATGVYHSMSSPGNLVYYDCNMTNSGASTTAANNSAGIVAMRYDLANGVFSTSSTGVINCRWTDINSSAINTTAITLAGTGTSTIQHCKLETGSAACLTAGAGTTANVRLCQLSTTGTNALTGAGTLNYALDEFTSGFGITTTTQNIEIATAFQKSVVQFFSASGTYTPTAGMKYCVIECVGGGGGGGGAATTGAATVSAGGGGGGGGYARTVATAATIGASQTVTIGAGGIAGANTGGGGGTGGSTSVGVICVAGGGSGGAGGSAGTQSLSNGGAGGSGSTGTVQLTTSFGQPGFAYTTAAISIGGNGGGGPFGGGGQSAVGGGGGNGSNGFNGGGAGGAARGNSQTGGTGGVGGGGIVIITEYV